MILQALADYYDVLREKGELPRPGWDKATKVSWALELNHDGTVQGLHPLEREVPSGKKTKMVPQRMETPMRLKKGNAIIPNFLWDNSGYWFGFDAKGDPKRTANCFQSSAIFHKKLLSNIDHPAAKAICSFFETWDTAAATTHEVLQDALDGLYKDDNIVFMVDGAFALDIPQIRAAWQTYYDNGMSMEPPQPDEAEQDVQMRCLVTGEKTTPERTHPLIKGVEGAQTSGAALVTFNAKAFCSYGRQQNLNAPVGKDAAFAYTAALNYLLRERDGNGRPRFFKIYGDTTVVFWAQDANEAYQQLAYLAFDGGDESVITNDDLATIIGNLAQGIRVEWNQQQLNPDNRFYVLGLSPNKARLSVRFFHQSCFGDFLRNIDQHNKRLQLVRPAFEKWENIPLWDLLDATVNQNAKKKMPNKQMAADTLLAMLSGGRYPATLYQQTMLRARAENASASKEDDDKPVKPKKGKDGERGTDYKKVSAEYKRTAIIKAYLLRNEAEKYKEVLTVKLNESTTYQPYVLGRMFSLLEKIQQEANSNINTTIKNKYFTSASATPSLVFPVLVNLAEKHLRKLEGTYYEERLGQIMAMLTESYPNHLSLYDQGIFQLGYYHQARNLCGNEKTEQEGTKNV